MTGPATPEREAAAAQLAALQADREALADRAMQPWWYDALLGLMTFGLTGTWVSGNRPGATRRAWWVWLVVATAVLLPALVLELVLDVRGAMVVAGAVLGAGIALVSRWWSRIYIAELRGRR